MAWRGVRACGFVVRQDGVAPEAKVTARERVRGHTAVGVRFLRWLISILYSMYSIPISVCTGCVVSSTVCTVYNVLGQEGGISDIKYCVIIQ